MGKNTTLHYFDVKGLGEPVRYMLAFTKVEHNDRRIPTAEWAQIKPQMPSGKVPMLEIDGKQLSQSSAILVYLANEHGLAGKGSWEIAKLQEVNGTTGDIQNAIAKVLFEQDAEKKKQVREELRLKMPEMFSALVRVAQLDKGNKFILGDKPSWADFSLAALTERLKDNATDGNATEQDKRLVDHLARVQALPGVREYISKRPQTPKEQVFINKFDSDQLSYQGEKMTKDTTLHYFNAKGLGEPIRYLLAYAKVQFNDRRIELEAWPQIKPQMPSGKVPMLEIDGKQLTQAVAIMFYLANEHGLAGKGSLEMAKLLEIDGTIGDIRPTFMKFISEQDAEKKKQILEELVTKTVPDVLTALTRLVKFDQGNKFVLGEKPTWADFKLASFTESIIDNFHELNIQQTNKHLTDHLDRVQALPGVKEYIAHRPQTPREREFAEKMYGSKK